ncbi:hypothetical protein J6590_062075 [Homalodisca vitripennis]|nr:hypothetical protein J6590_062075 [Homalodisca vitripennis]
MLALLCVPNVYKSVRSADMSVALLSDYRAMQKGDSGKNRLGRDSATEPLGRIRESAEEISEEEKAYDIAIVTPVRNLD